jgi:hypothetical protein
MAIYAYLGSLQIHKTKGSTKIVIAEILNNIGITFFEMDEFDKAQVYHSEALESLRQELGDDHADVAFVGILSVLSTKSSVTKKKH